MIWPPKDFFLKASDNSGTFLSKLCPPAIKKLLWISTLLTANFKPWIDRKHQPFKSKYKSENTYREVKRWFNVKLLNVYMFYTLNITSFHDRNICNGTRYKWLEFGGDPDLSCLHGGLPSLSAFLVQKTLKYFVYKPSSDKSR